MAEDANDAAPWAGRKYAYAGWVPNVHSHLSFSLIGKWRGPAVSARTQRYAKPTAAFACALEERLTDDFLAWQWVTRQLRPQVVQHFLLVGSTVTVRTPIGVIDLAVEAPEKTEPPRRRILWPFRSSQAVSPEPRGAQRRITVETGTDEQGMLRGRILIVPHQKEAADRARQARWIARLRAAIAHPADLSDDDLATAPVRFTDQAKANNHGVVVLEFALFRTGEARLWFSDEDGAKLNAQDRRRLSRQAYYFLKDMVHHHVHHDSKSDQITPLTETGCLTPDKAEEHWRRDTVWSLSRAIDELARRGMLKELREATGIIAYADAFQATLMRYRRQAEKPDEYEPNPVTYRYDFGHIRESLKVRVEQITARRTLRAQIFVAGVAGSIAATSLVVSAVSAHNGALLKKIDGVPIVLGVGVADTRWLAHFLWSPSILLALLLFVASWLWLSEERIGAPRAPNKKWAQSVRGLANSIALSRDWGGLAADRMVRWFYCFLLLAMGTSIWYAPTIVVGLLGLPPPVVPVPDPVPTVAQQTKDSDQNSPDSPARLGGQAKTEPTKQQFAPAGGGGAAAGKSEPKARATRVPRAEPQAKPAPRELDKRASGTGQNRPAGTAATDRGR